jgi:hypothetical protein
MSKKDRRLKREMRLRTFFSTLSAELTAATGTTEAQAFACDRLHNRMRKRAEITNTSLSEVAINKFVSVNNSLPSILLTVDPAILENARHFVLVALERFNTKLDHDCIQETFVLPHILDRWRYGPGTSLDVVGTHIAEKIGQRMTVTAECVPLLQRLRRNDPYFHAQDLLHGESWITVVKGAKLVTVPKNEETERTISVQPSGNMLLQLAAGQFLMETLGSIGLDITKQQPKNKVLAWIGSLTGDFATLDLASASDYVQTLLVRALFPAEWYSFLMKVRASTITTPSGDELELNMISEMGCGFTFPLMTFIFTALLYGYRASKGGPNLFIDWKTACVYGDDIIVKTHEYAEFVEVLESAGFVVNLTKSYSEGPFRESCGGDYWNGADVTPFYVQSLATDSDVYVAINQVLNWSARNNIPLLGTVSHLITLLEGTLFLIPEWMAPEQGVLTSLVERRYKYLRHEAESYRLERSGGEHFKCKLAVGGYIFTQGAHVFYTPEPKWRPVGVVCKARLPRGYLDGADPLSRTATASSRIAFWLSLLSHERDDASVLMNTI